MIDSAAIVSPTLASISQTNNVWKCPVLSGLTYLPDELDASLDNQTTCAQNSYHLDRTLTGHHPARPPHPQTPASVSKPKVAAASRRCASASRAVVSPTTASTSQTNNVWKCPVLSGLTHLPDELDASPDNQMTCAQNSSDPDRTLTGHQPDHFQPICKNSPGFPLRCRARRTDVIPLPSTPPPTPGILAKIRMTNLARADILVALRFSLNEYDRA